ncbi:60S acidic ribosomal protein P1-like [Eptesicus fuscus]|uniref:60S acidic ribosomal protein P1-like n=1 Tax=Eptesicus fuscus TaxID=29078 RepID=UPI0024042EB2|nr:60S acidic ribosomal protein P1-like [Eptesicus fuscus]
MIAFISELTCIYLAFILPDEEVTVTALANVDIGSLLCNVGAGEPVPAAGSALAGSPALFTSVAPAEERKVEGKKEESEESDDDIGFGLFD